MRARGNTACVTSSSTPTSCCAPDTNMRAEGERGERQHRGLWEMWSTLCMHVNLRCVSPLNSVMHDDVKAWPFFWVSSRKPDSYRFCWYLPLAGLKLRWVAEQERSQDTHHRLHSIRAKMFLLRQQLQQHKAVRYIKIDTIARRANDNTQ